MALGLESKWSLEEMIKKPLEQLGQKMTCITYGETVKTVV